MTRPEGHTDQGTKLKKKKIKHPKKYRTKNNQFKKVFKNKTLIKKMRRMRTKSSREKAKRRQRRMVMAAKKKKVKN